MDTAIWVALAGVLGAAGSLVVVITFWINRGKAEGEMHAKVNAAQSELAVVSAKVDLVSSQLAEARIDFATNYATHKDLAAAEVCYATALEGLRGELRGMNDRLDRIIDGYKVR